MSLGIEPEVVGLIDYPNIPKILGVAMSHAPLRDLDSVYSLEDMYDIIEKAAVDAHNSKQVAKFQKQTAAGRR